AQVCLDTLWNCKQAPQALSLRRFRLSAPEFSSPLNPKNPTAFGILNMLRLTFPQNSCKSNKIKFKWRRAYRARCLLATKPSIITFIITFIHIKIDQQAPFYRSSQRQRAKKAFISCRAKHTTPEIL